MIVVGATHGATAGYRSNADAAYAEAIKYTSHVTKVYSPNATWTKVKAAVKGANIVIYFGHGNGWPSPYTYDPKYTTKDGMGLNADLNGDGKLSDYENKYYGEPYMAQLALAPNAIVLLHNLCYASGNSEPGGAAPSRDGRPASGSTTTRRASSRAARGRSSPTATWARPLPPRPVHDRPVDPRPVALDAELPRPRVVVRLGPLARLRRLLRSRQRHEQLLPLARREARA